VCTYKKTNAHLLHYALHLYLLSRLQFMLQEYHSRESKLSHLDTHPKCGSKQLGLPHTSTIKYTLPQVRTFLQAGRASWGLLKYFFALCCCFLFLPQHQSWDICEFWVEEEEVSRATSQAQKVAAKSIEAQQMKTPWRVCLTRGRTRKNQNVQPFLQSEPKKKEMKNKESTKTYTKERKQHNVQQNNQQQPQQQHQAQKKDRLEI